MPTKITGVRYVSNGGTPQIVPVTDAQHAELFEIALRGSPMASRVLKLIGFAQMCGDEVQAERERRRAQSERQSAEGLREFLIAYHGNPGRGPAHSADWQVCNVEMCVEARASVERGGLS